MCDVLGAVTECGVRWAVYLGQASSSGVFINCHSWRRADAAASIHCKLTNRERCGAAPSAGFEISIRHSILSSLGFHNDSVGWIFEESPINWHSDFLCGLTTGCRTRIHAAFKKLGAVQRRLCPESNSASSIMADKAFVTVFGDDTMKSKSFSEYQVCGATLLVYEQS